METETASSSVMSPVTTIAQLQQISNTCRQIHCETALLIFQCSKFYSSSSFGGVEWWINRFQQHQSDAITTLGFVLNVKAWRGVEGYVSAIISGLSLLAGLECVHIRLAGRRSPQQDPQYDGFRQELSKAIQLSLGKDLKIFFNDSNGSPILE